MNNGEWLAERFEANRKYLQAVAYRMLGSPAEAEDAVQETWIRFSRSDTSSVENLGGWLTTVVARVCLDMLRSRKARREEPIDAQSPGQIASIEVGIDPEREALLADSVGLALLVVLEKLDPSERIALVLHDMFALPFDQIAPIVGRSPAATRQLASRARRRVRGAAAVPEANLARQRKIIDAFLAASRRGDFEALLTLLDPDVLVRADRAAVDLGASAEIQGAAQVAQQARFFSRRARFLQPALVNGSVGAVVAPRGRLVLALAFQFTQDRIIAIDLIAEPKRLRQLNLARLAS